MHSTIRAAIILSAIASAFVASAAHADPKAPKGGAVKVHLCESVDVYTGGVDENHPATRIAESCRDVSVKAAQKAIDKCTSEGSAETCEVLYSADKKTIMIERKILVSEVSR